MTIQYTAPATNNVFYVYSGAQKMELHVAVKRYPIKDMPTTDEELSKWLRKRFEEKDQAVDYFKTNGKYDPKIYKEWDETKPEKFASFQQEITKVFAKGAVVWIITQVVVFGSIYKFLF
jgi:hypothetical protein